MKEAAKRQSDTTEEPKTVAEEAQVLWQVSETCYLAC